MIFEQLIDRPIAFQRCFVRLGIGITGALMLSQAIYWSNRTKDGSGWFWKTIEEWEEETGLTRYEQDTAKRKLKELGILETVRIKIPAKLHFKVNFKRLEELLIKATNQQTRLSKSNKTDCGNPANCDDENQQTNTENTTEITTEITNSDKSELASHEIANPEMEIFYQQVMDCFNETLPELGRIKKLSQERKNLLNERYRQHEEHQTIDFWKDYFEFVKDCNLLVGKIPRKNGTIWKADFDWLLKYQNFNKVTQGKYYDDNRTF